MLSLFNKFLKPLQKMAQEYSEDLFADFYKHVVLFFFTDGTISYRRQQVACPELGYVNGDLADFQRGHNQVELAVVLGCGGTGVEALNRAQAYFREVARIDGVEGASDMNMYELFGCDVSASQFVHDLENGSQDILEAPYEESSLPSQLD